MNRMVVIGLALMVLVSAGAQAQNAVPQGAGRQVPRQDARWDAERAAMLKVVLDRVRAHVRDVLTRIQIGTAAAMDASPSEQMLKDLEVLVETDAKRVAPRAVAEIAALRIRFAEAMNALDLAEIRFDVGLLTTENMRAALMAPANVVLVPR